MLSTCKFICSACQLLHVSYYMGWEAEGRKSNFITLEIINHFLKGFQAFSNADVYKSKYCPIAAAPRIISSTPHTGLTKMVCNIKYKIGVYLSKHTNKCTYIVFNNLKFTLKLWMVVPCIWFEIRVNYQLDANIVYFSSTCFGPIRPSSEAIEFIISFTNAAYGVL